MLLLGTVKGMMSHAAFESSILATRSKAVLDEIASAKQRLQRCDVGATRRLKVQVAAAHRALRDAKKLSKQELYGNAVGANVPDPQGGKQPDKELDEIEQESEHDVEGEMPPVVPKDIPPPASTQDKGKSNGFSVSASGRNGIN